jgi:hypothetical protein
VGEVAVTDDEAGQVWAAIQAAQASEPGPSADDPAVPIADWWEARAAAAEQRAAAFDRLVALVEDEESGIPPVLVGSLLDAVRRAAAGERARAWEARRDAEESRR